MPGGFSCGHFKHGLVEIRVKLLAHGLKLADVVALEHVEQFPLGHFDAVEELLHHIINDVALIRRHGSQGA